ncbi:MAG TPA: DUF4386 family protein [Ornithinibacter sp.]|nr:DUF4386 family protein [Ornithinibacter sp.]
MTTATLRTDPTTGPAAVALRAPERRGARLAGWSLLAMTLLALPVAGLLDGADRPGTRVAVGTAFLLIAVLDVVVGVGLYALLRARAHSSAYAALVSRTGYAVLLAASAGRLLRPGGGGVETFRADWALALVVFGLHLVITAVALHASRVVPFLVVASTALAGAAYLLDESLARWADVGWGPVLVPFMLGELVLMGWLLRVAHRRPNGVRSGAGRVVKDSVDAS